MWRALFLAVGLTCMILGAECLALEKAVLYSSNDPTLDSREQDALPRREIVPPEWAPWSLLGGGAVVILYSFTIPARVRS